MHAKDQPARDERPRAPLQAPLDVPVRAPTLVERKERRTAPRPERSPFGRWLRGGRA